MAIRARIGITRPDGFIASIYVHDLPNWQVLLYYWNNQDRAGLLISKGNVWRLGPLPDDYPPIVDQPCLVHDSQDWPSWGEAWHYWWTDSGWMVREAGIGNDGYNNGYNTEWVALTPPVTP
jgi:hypothetical protein